MGISVGISNSPAAGATFNFADDETPSGTINGVNASFTLLHPPNPSASVDLVKNRIQMIPGTDFTVSASTITYQAGSIPQIGDIHFVAYRY